MISFALTTHNEGRYVYNLLEQILGFMRDDDEIVILDDYSDDQETIDAIEYFGCKIHSRKFDGHFAEHKNYLNSLCKGDWIFQIDADELLSSGLASRLHALLDMNHDVDLIFVPRVNTVDGLTADDITNFGWKVNERGWVMWPDYQGRIYRNTPKIRWEGKVHEKIVGAMKHSFLPDSENWAIIHAKDVNRQRDQNALYSTLA